MTSNRAAQAVLSLLRTAVPSAIAFVGLTAVIVGILAMHVWMSGRGSSSHHVAAPATTSTTTSTITSTHAGDETVHVHAGAHTDVRAGTPVEVHTQITPAVIAAMAAMEATTLDAVPDDASALASEDGLLGCGGECTDEMMLGVCVLAMIVVGIAGLLTPAGRALLSILGRRGPPALSWASRPARAPSLTQLCISRT